MKRMIFIIVLSAVLIFTGCATQSGITTGEEKVADEETNEEEDVVEEVTDEDDAEKITEESSIDEVIEKVDTEKEVIEEPVAEPKPPAAKFKPSNLQITHTPEVSETSYTVTINVQNTGDLKGIYRFKPKVNDELLETTVEVELSPGQSRNITLTEVEELICSFAARYKNGEIFKQTHSVRVEGCYEKITFPKVEYLLQLLSTFGQKYGEEQIVMHGQVKNISEKNLDDVEAVIELFSENGELVSTMSKLIARNPIEPGQTSSFDVTDYSREAKRYIVYFRYKEGDRIPVDYGEYEAYRPD